MYNPKQLNIFLLAFLVTTLIYGSKMILDKYLELKEIEVLIQVEKIKVDVSYVDIAINELKEIVLSNIAAYPDSSIENKNKKVVNIGKMQELKGTPKLLEPIVSVNPDSSMENKNSKIIDSSKKQGFRFISVCAIPLGHQSVELSWQTANDKQNGNYIVYYSTTKSNFDVIGQAITGKGLIDTSDFKLIESAKFGRNYFQVKYLDDDDKEYFSKIVTVLIQPSESTGRTSIPVIIYPNPTYDEFSLEFAEPIKSVITITIVDKNGRIIEEVELQPAISKHDFNSIEYDSGTYRIILAQRNKKLKEYQLVVAKK